MDVIALGCALAETRGFSGLMRVASALGHGAIAAGLASAGLAAALLLPALAARRRRVARAALAALVAVAVAGIAANLLKLGVDSPRPYLGNPSPGFPSGHTAIAFAAAAVLARAVPGGAPLFFLAAMLTGVARLYLEAHFAVDVAGGAVLGALTGWLSARRLVDQSGAARPATAPGRWLWALPLGLAALAAVFFVAYEREVAAQRAAPALAAGQPDLSIAFGQPDARPVLGHGWSGDERWDGRIPFVWAVGPEADLRLPALPARDHDVRLRLAPFVSRDGLSCQQAEISINGWSTGRLVLARGWRDYVVTVPGTALSGGHGQVRFRFAYTARPGEHDPRPLSAAFAALEARPRP